MKISFDAHLYGSTHGYQELSSSSGVKYEESQCLNTLGFGEIQNDAIAESLETTPVVCGRPLTTGRIAITRFFQGPKDDAGRRTVELRTMIISQKSWRYIREGRIKQFCADSKFWERDLFLVKKSQFISVEFSSSLAESTTELNTIYSSLSSNPEASFAFPDSTLSNIALVSLLEKLPFEDTLKISWGLRMLSSGLKLSVCSIHPIIRKIGNVHEIVFNAGSSGGGDSTVSISNAGLLHSIFSQSTTSNPHSIIRKKRKTPVQLNKKFKQVAALWIVIGIGLLAVLYWPIEDEVSTSAFNHISTVSKLTEGDVGSTTLSSPPTPAPATPAPPTPAPATPAPATPAPTAPAPTAPTPTAPAPTAPTPTAPTPTAPTPTTPTPTTPTPTTPTPTTPTPTTPTPTTPTPTTPTPTTPTPTTPTPTTPTPTTPTPTTPTPTTPTPTTPTPTAPVPVQAEFSTVENLILFKDLPNDNMSKEARNTFIIDSENFIDELNVQINYLTDKRKHNYRRDWYKARNSLVQIWEASHAGVDELLDYKKELLFISKRQLKEGKKSNHHVLKNVVAEIRLIGLNPSYNKFELMQQCVGFLNSFEVTYPNLHEVMPNVAFAVREFETDLEKEDDDSKQRIYDQAYEKLNGNKTISEGDVIKTIGQYPELINLKIKEAIRLCSRIKELDEEQVDPDVGHGETLRRKRDNETSKQTKVDDLDPVILKIVEYFEKLADETNLDWMNKALIDLNLAKEVEKEVEP